MTTEEDKTQVQRVVKTGVSEPVDSSMSRGQMSANNASVMGTSTSIETEETRLTTGLSDFASREDASNPQSVLPFASSLSSAHLAVGDVLKGRFEIVEMLGEGGMGVVFKARDMRKLEAKSRNPYVAIKVLNPALAKNATLIAGLQRECEKAQELSHPNIITVYDFDRDGDYVFMSMEYLAGWPLAKIIRDTSASGGIKLERAWPIIRQMGEALVYAHKKHIVHSDFKPANVFVTDKDEVKVLDFGIASRLGQSDSDETLFDARAEGGLTPPYASFEMLNGSRADPRDDIYAFGLVVYELLAGRHPYDRKPASTVFLEQRGGQPIKPKPIPGLSRKQWQLLKASIEILQEQRPPRLDEWLAQFDPKKQSKPLYAVVSGLFVLSLGVLGYFYWHWATSINIPQKPRTALEKVEADKPAPAPTREPPVANVSGDTQGLVGVTAVLNGSGSRSPSGIPLSYSWRLIDRPAASNAVLTNPDSVSPQFEPDQAGHYVAELVVTDAAGGRSLPVTLAVDVSQPVAKAPTLLHEATSSDGVLYLAATKPNYVIGQELKLKFHLAKVGYLRVAYVGSSGEVSELFPNKYQSGKVKPDVDYQIPPKSSSFKLQVTGPIGKDKIVAVFSPSPIPNVKNIATADGQLVDELKDLSDSSVVIQYQVSKK